MSEIWIWILVRLRVFLVQTAAEEEEQIEGLNFMKKIERKNLSSDLCSSIEFYFSIEVLGMKIIDGRSDN